MSKTPTAGGVSRILSQAGFANSKQDDWGFETQFKKGAVYRYDPINPNNTGYQDSVQVTCSEYGDTIESHNQNIMSMAQVLRDKGFAVKVNHYKIFENDTIKDGEKLWLSVTAMSHTLWVAQNKAEYLRNKYLQAEQELRELVGA